MFKSLYWAFVVTIIGVFLIAGCGRRPDVLERPVEEHPLRSYPDYDDPKEAKEDKTRFALRYLSSEQEGRTLMVCLLV